MMKKTLVCAHRGASGYAPENTLVAFQKAMEMGADEIELDVQMTKDGELVIIHDETIDRVSDGCGWVKDYTYDELLRFNFGKLYPDCGFVKIPTLKEVYLLVKGTGITVNVELKNGYFFYDQLEDKVLSLAKEMELEDQVYYSSFNHYSIMKLKQLNSKVSTGFLYMDGYMDMPDYALRHQVEALHPPLYNLKYPNFLEDCRSKNINLRPWTINDPEDMRMLCENEIHTMITNYPDIARKVVDDYKQ